MRFGKKTILAGTTALALMSTSTFPVMAEESGKMDELTKIVVCITCAAASADTALVQDAINEITVPAINVEIELKDVTIVDALYASYFTLGISSGEQMDLIQLPYTNLNSYVDSFQLEPLDELLKEYAPTLMELSEEFPIFDAGTIKGEIYGVDPVMRSYGYQSSIIVRKDYLDELDFKLDKEIYGYDDFTEIFAGIKKNHPDCYPFTFATLGRSNFGVFNIIDPLGGSDSNGVLMGTDSTTVVNMYETEEYKEFLKVMREWYEAGYILPDAATTDLTCTDLLISGKAAAAQSNNAPDTIKYSKLSYDHEYYSLPTTENHIVATTSAGSVHWAVPVTSESPEAAIRFLDLMYSDARIAQLLYSGIEGTHYVVADDHVEYPEGVTPETAGYQNGWDLFGDTRNLTFFSAYDKDAFEEYSEKNLNNPTKAVGFCVDVTDEAQKLMSIDSVVAQYVAALETGSVEDYEGTLQTMIDRLKAAGIDDVIEDVQEQFDAWLAEE